MKINIFPHNIVLNHIRYIKKDWTAHLAKYGYIELEKDSTDDGRWHKGFRPLGKVAFWKLGRKGLDGIVISHNKFYILDGATINGIGVYSIGEAREYFKNLGFKKIDLKKAIITLNNKQYNSARYESMDFYNFIKSKINILS